MRITYRNTKNADYWKKRWSDIEVDEPMSQINAYPLKYANMIVKDKNHLILEAGCGAGRLLRYYHEKNFKIIGIEFFEEIVDKIKKKDRTLDVRVDNILRLKFKENFFDCVLAFGLYHNFKDADLDKALSETYRVIKKGGKLTASFRADNIQEKIIDFLRKDKNQDNKEFHKLNLKKKEFEILLKKHNFKIIKTFNVQNMPFLYKFRIFRKNTHKEFNESISRKEGYKLSILGTIIQKFLINIFPKSFCNLYLIIAEKN